jgi:hypothetical protein
LICRTSWKGAQWQVDTSEQLKRFVQAKKNQATPTCLVPRKKTDAILRGVDRYEAYFDFLLFLNSSKVTRIAGLTTGLIFWGLASWSSYHRNVSSTAAADHYEILDKDNNNYSIKFKRIVDALLRCWSRGMGARKTSALAIQLICKVKSSAASFVIGGIISGITAWTSYVNTRWWTDDREELTGYLSTRAKSSCTSVVRVTDAFFRGNSRASTTISLSLLVLGKDALIPAAGFSVAALTLCGWASNQRSKARLSYAEALLEDQSPAPQVAP